MAATKHLWLLLISVVCFIGLGATQVTATGPLSPAAQQPPPRECTVTKEVFKEKVTVRIVAGPGPDGEPFPLVVEDCPSFFTGFCKKWVYRFSLSGSGAVFTHGALSVDRDIAVLAAPGGTVSEVLNSISLGEGERFLKYNGSGTSFDATYLTPLDAEPGTYTAAFAIKKGFLPLLGSCALAGADRPPPSDPDAAVLVAAAEQAGQCIVNIFRGPDGAIVKIELQPGSPCSITQQGTDITSVKINGETVRFIAESKATTGDGTCYSWFSRGRWYQVCS
jgi:hypothetical protein